MRFQRAANFRQLFAELGNSDSMGDCYMTIRGWAVQYCVERGMFEHEAKTVVDLVINDPENNILKGRWHESTDGYDSTVLNGLALSINRHALRWIDESAPRAWYKSMFEESAEVQEL